MDGIERLNKRFGAWYESLLGGGSKSGDLLRPRDILRRIIGAMEDKRREGLDGQVYIPNVYTLQIAPQNDEERDYLRAFLDADDLAAEVKNAADRHGYKIRGGLQFTVEEVDAPPPGEGRVKIVCKFDASVSAPVSASFPSPPSASERGSLKAEASSAAVAFAPAIGVGLPLSASDERSEGRGERPDDDEPGTMPALPAKTLASLVVRGENGQFMDAYPLGISGATLGRGKQAGNSIVLAHDSMVSKKHARIVRENDRFVLLDENSTNGTAVVSEGANGEVPVVFGGPGRVLRDNDQIRLGETVLLFRSNEAVPAFAAPVSSAFAPKRSGTFFLIAGDGETFPLASEMSVGRSLTGDIVLIGNGVAYQHARITSAGGEVKVQDLESPGGTYVNGERIAPLALTALRNGDQIAFGEVLLRLEQRVGNG